MAKIPSPVTLSSLVSQTANELREIKANEPDDPVMQFAECSVEVAVNVTADANGKVNFVLWEAGGGVAYENTQKVSLTFKAVGQGFVARVEGDGLAPLPNRED